MRRADRSLSERKRAAVAAVPPASPQVGAHRRYSRNVNTTDR